MTYRGLKYFSKYRSERIEAITRFLENSDFDIVALQELWVQADYHIVRSRISRLLPFSKCFYRCDRKAPSPGLLLLQFRL